MVNSYLHVGVEYGLPVLAASVALAAGFRVFSGMSAYREDGGSFGCADGMAGKGEWVVSGPRYLSGWRLCSKFSLGVLEE